QVGAFRQFDRTKYEQQGLGLGLTLAQHVIERNGGSFQLESTPGKGTVATATWARLEPAPSA
ncbi:MAG TPA: ATP-binding protein, partial [Opitutaceae bacterium]|nr:ATP-binding protein [Opitutaceae bacterium]